MLHARVHSFTHLAFSGGHVASYPCQLLAPSGAPSISAPRLKRAVDLTVALLLLVVFGSLMLMIAALIRLTSPGPALFTQERVGLHGQRFRMLKFRTMHPADEMPGYCPQATRNDPRVTPLGRLLRRTSCDELPQLLNVLAGTMSIVGPRPHAPGTCAAGRPFEAISLSYDARHSVKPGITGLAQVRGWRGQTDTEAKLLHRLDSDLEYIANWSLIGDLLIMARTVPALLCMRNAW